MHCTSCQQGELQPSFIDNLFRAHCCDHCGGHWLLIEDYVTWLENNAVPLPTEDADVDVDDSKKALLCPVTGTLMQKYRYTLKGEHRLDYSARIGGVWLDKGEWAFLKQQGLAGLLNRILTEPWQKQLREGNAKAVFAQLYETKFGAKDYQKAKDIRQWLQAHPAKAELRAYLLAYDPYSTER